MLFLLSLDISSFDNSVDPDQQRLAEPRYIILLIKISLDISSFVNSVHWSRERIFICVKL